MRAYFHKLENSLQRGEWHKQMKKQQLERQDNRKALMMLELYKDVIEEKEAVKPLSERMDLRTKELERLGYLCQGELSEKGKDYIIQNAHLQVLEWLNKKAE